MLIGRIEGVGAERAELRDPRYVGVCESAEVLQCRIRCHLDAPRRGVGSLKGHITDPNHAHVRRVPFLRPERAAVAGVAAAAAGIGSRGHVQVEVQPGHGEREVGQRLEAQQLRQLRSHLDIGVVHDQGAAVVLGQDVQVTEGQQVAPALVTGFE
ncbi:MAG: hypothetical protein ACRD2Z_01650 [Thermoanaerobaculia bacterium]